MKKWAVIGTLLGVIVGAGIITHFVLKHNKLEQNKDTIYTKRIFRELRNKK